MINETIVNPHFDGITYKPKLDHKRLTKQIHRVRNIMSDGQWRTLKVISELVGAPEASVSARLRDLRKLKFGDYQVNHRRLSNGTWEYQVLLK